MQNREFIRKIFHPISDKDIRDLKNGLVSILVVQNIFLSIDALTEQLKRIGNLKKQDGNNDFIYFVKMRKDHPGRPFHIDRSYHPKPPRFSALYALKAPNKNKGGATYYCDLQKAYQELPQKMIKKIEQMKLLYFNRYMANSANKKHIRHYHILSAVHPLVQSDKTGKYLFFSLEHAANFPLKKKLYQHICQPAYIYKHHWSVFDLIVSNNFKTCHKQGANFGLDESLRKLVRIHID